MRRFTLDLPEPVFRTLQRLAEAERRSVRDQAAVLLERSLDRRRRADGGARPVVPLAPLVGAAGRPA